MLFQLSVCHAPSRAQYLSNLLKISKAVNSDFMFPGRSIPLCTSSASYVRPQLFDQFRSSFPALGTTHAREPALAVWGALDATLLEFGEPLLSTSISYLGRNTRIQCQRSESIDAAASKPPRSAYDQQENTLHRNPKSHPALAYQLVRLHRVPP